ncbi:Nn.00g104430.m01.CDS01 [Neocucurbitaria sp. VM-36]
MSFNSPFGASTSKPGHGSIVLDILPPDKPVLRTVSYQYPLKLVVPDALPPSPSSHSSTEEEPTNTPRLIHTIFLLTYGGGIVAGDTINLDVQLASNTRLILLTQGSTKIFKTPSPDLVSEQHMAVHLKVKAALVYLPDPVQPFAQTAFSQSQIYHLENGQGNLCVCDWVTSGRSARGENWDIYSYKSRNEVWSTSTSDSSSSNPTKRLLLRDNLLLSPDGCTNLPLSSLMSSFSVFGTLILHGPLFTSLSTFFLSEFELLPRIGGRNWGDTPSKPFSPAEQRRAERLKKEKDDGLIWSAASVRGFVLVKFASREVEGAREWVRDMIREEGSLVREFGERAVLCLK